MIKVPSWIIFLVASILVGCSSIPENDDQVNLLHQNDPFQRFNRAMFSINSNYLDPYILRPASVVYGETVPKPVRGGISNFFDNLDEPASMVNNLMMGEGNQALAHLNRFWINSTFGLLGFIDFASAAGIKKYDDRAFSDMLGSHGVGHGPYIMLPGYGPITLRKTTDAVDSLYLPLSYLNVWTGFGKWVVQGLEKRYQLISHESTLNLSPDPYALSREVYIQRRNFKAGITETFAEEEEDFIDDYLDEGFE